MYFADGIFLLSKFVFLYQDRCKTFLAASSLSLSNLKLKVSGPVD